MINKHYPFVNKTIEYLIDTLGGRDFAILLQRIEIHLVIDQIVPSFQKECPSAPIITIHDSIITNEIHVLTLEKVMREVLLRETNIEPGLTIELLKPRPLQDKEVTDIYEKVKRKPAKRKFKKIEWSLLDRNIKYAESFMNREIIKEGVKLELNRQRAMGQMTFKVPHEKYLSRSEIADLLHVTEVTLNNWEKQNILIPKRIGRRVLYKESEVFEKLDHTA